MIFWAKIISMCLQPIAYNVKHILTKHELRQKDTTLQQAVDLLLKTLFFNHSLVISQNTVVLFNSFRPNIDLDCVSRIIF